MGTCTEPAPSAQQAWLPSGENKGFRTWAPRANTNWSSEGGLTGWGQEAGLSWNPPPRSAPHTLRRALLMPGVQAKPPCPASKARGSCTPPGLKGSSASPGQGMGPQHECSLALSRHSGNGPFRVAAGHLPRGPGGGLDCVPAPLQQTLRPAGPRSSPRPLSGPRLTPSPTHRSQVTSERRGDACLGHLSPLVLVPEPGPHAQSPVALARFTPDPKALPSWVSHLCSRCPLWREDPISAQRPQLGSSCPLHVA